VYEPKREVGWFQIDANRINARGKQPNMSRLEKWAEDGVIYVSMAEEARKEASVGSSARARKAFFIEGTLAMPSTAGEWAALRQVEAILFPRGARDENERHDVLIAFQAKKYLSRLITADGNTLRNREQLLALGIEVMTDAEAVAWVEERISQRDALAKEHERELGRPLPEWVGKDL
jgi:hypothetical protein